MAVPPACDWPYNPAFPDPREPVPTWECPGQTCHCHAPPPPGATKVHSIFLHDEKSRRMPHARCRILFHGRVIHGAVHADGEGAVALEITDDIDRVMVEWAPEDATPRSPPPPSQSIRHQST